MKILIEIMLLLVMTIPELKSQEKTRLSQFYVRERGTMVTLLIFKNQNLYFINYHKPGQLGFCYKSSFSIKGDTLLTEKFGSFLIRRELVAFKKIEISKGSKYKPVKSVKSIKRFINCLSPYGIFWDSSQIEIPRHLIGT